MNRYLRNSDFELFRLIKERYAPRYPHHLWEKGDAFLKIASIIYYFQMNDIRGKTIVDIGSGDSPLDIILAQEFGNHIVCIDKEFNLDRMQYKVGEFIQGDFFEVVPNLSFKVDGFVDGCSVCHFDPTSNKLIPNMGIYRVGQAIQNKLESGGFYVSSQDTIPLGDQVDLRYRREFIPPYQILNSYQWPQNTNFDMSEDDMYIFHPFQDNPPFRLGVAQFEFIK